VNEERVVETGGADGLRNLLFADATLVAAMDVVVVLVLSNVTWGVLVMVVFAIGAVVEDNSFGASVGAGVDAAIGAGEAACVGEGAGGKAPAGTVATATGQ